MRVLRFIGRVWTVLLGCVVLVLMLALTVRLVLPFAPWLERPNISIAPADGASEVVPRSSIRLTFSQPMNRHSVERALRITPPTEGALAWRDAGRTLTFTPRPSLTAGVTYTVSLDTSALSRWWRPLQAATRVTFNTARAPATLAALPNTDDVPTDSAVALVFSQPMVAPDMLDTPIDLPELTIQPAVAGEARWIGVDTLLLRPSEPLLPNTRYQATIDALVDPRGSELVRPFTWSWTTRGPTLWAHSPADGARWIAPRQPLVLTLSQPLGLDLLRDSLSITPTITGDLTAALLPEHSQIITFTPTVDWEPNRTYTVLFGMEQRQPGASQPETASTWSFTTAPRPALVGRFPGQGQLLPRGQAVRLIFSTPMDADVLRAGLTVQPAVDDVRVIVNDTRVQLQADLQPSTTYTLTIGSGVVDRNGVPLESDYRLRFLTAPAAPMLRLPDVPGHIVSMSPDQPVNLNFERTNLSALNLALYGLDEATLLRTLRFNSSDWQDFRPERYNQPLLRAWQVGLADRPDQIVRAVVPITLTADPLLAPGAYYLQARTPEGPQVDVVVLVSNVELALKQSDTQVVVWATDIASGTPLANVPLTLYAGDAVVAQGRSSLDGLWQVNHRHRPGDSPYLVIASDPELGMVSSEWRLSSNLPAVEVVDNARYRSALTTDRPAYKPGETVLVGGFVRRALPNHTLSLPVPGTRLDLALHPALSGDRPVALPITRTSLLLPPGGVVSASLLLDPQTPPGDYMLRATLDDETTRLSLRVLPPDRPLDLDFDAIQIDINDQRAFLPLRVSSANLPVAGADVVWSARGLPAEVLPASPLAEGFRFGDAAQAPVPPVVLNGSGQTDGAGTVGIPLPDRTTLTQTLRFEISVQVAEPGGPSAEAATTLTLNPAGTRVGVRLPSRIVMAGERAVVELATLNASDNPDPGASIVVEVYRRTWTRRSPPASAPYLEPGDTRVLIQPVSADDQGRARLELPLPGAGEYRIVAIAGLYRSATTLWSTAPGFTGWQDEGERISVITDRDSYRPGETARLLVTLPVAEATALLTLEQSGVISPEVRTMQAGQLLDVTITPDMAPNIYFGAIVLQRGAAGGYARVKAGYAELHVLADTPVLTTTLTPDQAVYLPGATATLTITTSDPQGIGVPASLVLAVTEEVSNNDIAPQAILDPLIRFNPRRAAGFVTASSSTLRVPRVESLLRVTQQTPQTTEAAFNPRHARLAYWNANLHTGLDGTLVIRIPLPSTSANWQVETYAARETDLFGHARLTLAAAAPLEVRGLVPPLLRAGDSAEAALVVRNTTALSQEVRAALAADGVALEAGAVMAQTQLLLPGDEHRFVWGIRGGAVAQRGSAVPAQARLDFSAEAVGIDRVETSLTLPIELGGAAHTRTETFELTESLSHTVVISALAGLSQPPATLCQPPASVCPWATLELEVAPSIRAAVVSSANSLVALPQRSVEQEASLLLLSALLAQNAGEDEARIWHDQAQRSLAALDAMQSGDGGWGWWPGSPAHPFMTGYVLEAQAVAGSVLQADIQPDPDGLALLRAADHPGADPDLRAYIQYVFALVGAGDPADARALLDRNLHADGLAYLALALPPDQATAPLSRLLALPRRFTATRSASGGEGPRLAWEPAGAARTARSTISTTGLAVQALQRLQPDSPLLPPALRTLRLEWGVGGWPTAFDSARAAAALLAAVPPDVPRPQPYVLSFNGRSVLPDSQPVSGPRHTLLAGAQLRARNTLRLQPQPADDNSVQALPDQAAQPVRLASPLLLAYTLREQVQSDPARSSALAVHQDYLDPVSNAAFDPAALRLGQLVRVRLTLIATEPVAYVSLAAPLPAAFALVDTEDELPTAGDEHSALLLVGRTTEGTVMFAGSDLAPGVYTRTYLARVVNVGTFAVPPPHALPAFTPADMAWGLSERIVVTRP